DSTADYNTSSEKYNITNDAANNNSSFDLQYLITFKHNNYEKMIINHIIDYKDLFIIKKQDYITNYATDSEYKESAKSTYKQSEKSR
ncbi:9846_t:CDS:1, partial [Cetraspora pellucida]